MQGAQEQENIVILRMVMNLMHVSFLTVSSNTFFPSTGVSPAIIKCIVKLPPLMARTTMLCNGRRGGEILPLLDMPHSLPEQGNDVVVFDAVVDFLTVPPSDDQVHLTQAT